MNKTNQKIDDEEYDDDLDGLVDEDNDEVDDDVCPRCGNFAFKLVPYADEMMCEAHRADRLVRPPP